MVEVDALGVFKLEARTLLIEGAEETDVIVGVRAA